MSTFRTIWGALVVLCTATTLANSPASAQEQRKPNIVVIMGDDVGIWNIGAYHQGVMSGKTPNLDKLASQGMRFTDYYAEASCTAGRANFMTGELPIRTGLTTVGQAGADVGLPDEAVTIATILKSMGYTTGQFGKNHFGDLNKYLPTLHGLDEFHGYLYHLDAMSDPFWYSFPQDPAFLAKYGPRNVIHSWATDTDDPTVQPRWGKIGKQKILDDGPLPPFPNMAGHDNWSPDSRGAKYNMETFDDVLLQDTFAFMDRAKSQGKPFFIWHNTTRMHVWTFLSEKYRSLMNSQTNFGLYEAGMAQLDDIVGSIMKHLDDIGEADNTILMFTTDNGAMVWSWPDGGMTPYQGQKGMATEGAFRVPAIIRWPGKIKPGTVENGIFSGLDWLPTFVAAAGDPDITQKLLNGVKLGDRTYKNHLDGYNQLDLLLGKAPSARHELFYFAGPKLGALRIDNFKFKFFDQPDGWPGAKLDLDIPLAYNIRQDPFERTPLQNWGTGSAGYLTEFLAREFWRFVEVQDYVGKLGASAVNYPPMQDPASFNLAEVKRKIDAAVKTHPGE
jgi:arylsulfatase A-like enzyme